MKLGPHIDRLAARSIAIDAFLEGNMALGQSILKEARTQLTKPQAPSQDACLCQN